MLKVVVAGATIEVSFKTHEISLRRGFRVDPFDQKTSCTGSRVPCSVVDSLQIEVNGRRILVGRSSFCDLSDINTARVEVAGKSFLLNITGGDGAESYIATIRFNTERLTRRTLASGIEPNKPTQVTTYYRLPPID